MTHDTWQSNCGHFRRNLTCAIVHHVSHHVSMITLRHWLIFLCPLIFYVHLMLTCHQCSAKMTQISVMRSVVEFGPLFCLLKAVGRDTGVYIVVVLVGRESFVLIWLYCWRLRFEMTFSDFNGCPLWQKGYWRVYMSRAPSGFGMLVWYLVRAPKTMRLTMVNDRTVHGSWHSETVYGVTQHGGV